MESHVAYIGTISMLSAACQHAPSAVVVFSHASGGLDRLWSSQGLPTHLADSCARLVVHEMPYFHRCCYCYCCLPLLPPVLTQGGDACLSARLLQALRWRLLHAPPGPARWHLLAGWVELDFLDCHAATHKALGCVAEVHGEDHETADVSGAQRTGNQAVLQVRVAHLHTAFCPCL